MIKKIFYFLFLFESLLQFENFFLNHSLVNPRSILAIGDSLSFGHPKELNNILKENKYKITVQKHIKYLGDIHYFSSKKEELFRVYRPKILLIMLGISDSYNYPAPEEKDLLTQQNNHTFKILLPEFILSQFRKVYKSFDNNINTKISEIQNLVNSNKQEANFYINLSELYILQNNYLMAEKTLLEGLKKCHLGKIILRNSLANLYMTNKKYDKAILLYDRIYFRDFNIYPNFLNDFQNALIPKKSHQKLEHFLLGLVHELDTFERILVMSGKKEKIHDLREKINHFLSNKIFQTAINKNKKAKYLVNKYLNNEITFKINQKDLLSFPYILISKDQIKESTFHSIAEKNQILYKKEYLELIDFFLKKDVFVVFLGMPYQKDTGYLSQYSKKNYYYISNKDFPMNNKGQYFRDNAAGNFGHFTALGARIFAQNIFNNLKKFKLID